MAAATVIIGETNGASSSNYYNHTGAGISNSNFGGTDAYELNTTTYPIIAGQNSFEKWQQFEVTSLGTSAAVKNLKVWYTGTLAGLDTLKYNGWVSADGGAYSDHSKVTLTGYVQPVGGTSASTIAAHTMPTSAPTSSNIGIGGSLTGSLTGTGRSDYIVMQLHVDTATTVGATITIYYQYDEVA